MGVAGDGWRTGQLEARFGSQDRGQRVDRQLHVWRWLDRDGLVQADQLDPGRRLDGDGFTQADRLDVRFDVSATPNPGVTNHPLAEMVARAIAIAVASFTKQRCRAECAEIVEPGGLGEDGQRRDGQRGARQAFGLWLIPAVGARVLAAGHAEVERLVEGVQLVRGGVPIGLTSS